MALGETELIRTYFANLTAARADVVLGPGDDAAILALPSDRELAASADTLVEGVHFSPGAAAADVGYKSLAVNLSDMAAMGAEPCWATLALTIPEADDAWLRSFAEGFAEAADEEGVALVGGDVTRGPRVITVQILGLIPRAKAIRRSGAMPGDLIFVTGTLGGAGAALAFLKGEMTRPRHDYRESLKRLCRPRARVGMGILLRGIASAAIDISDGLYTDLQHLVSASNVGASVQLSSIPVTPALDGLTDVGLRWDMALGSGDDYELCFTVPQSRVADLESRLAKSEFPPVSRVGEITSGGGIHWIQADGTRFKPSRSGYQHF